ncbi:NADH:flavin oxidoreductase/NADH oxidase family protein [Kutzneria albida]|uniref:Oxidoreductase, FAD/FMN-binding protein n=1 Tax=Kutzneria albida DSM 43870 TaxID=1449976 RepID=W5VZZ2_9PSEU|nr:NADH:flavin oxidoreductase/NADH oxidase family protein [Kutzneria albida]AHH93861.1 oxidoreductase, FAD/FMN-binding protein [Kutzneria albida DSM 43870]
MLDKPLRLPCGATLPNRLAKAAMSEQLATRTGAPTEALRQLYRVWGGSGAGLLVTGNVMVDRTALTEPRNAILEDERYLPAYRSWAQAAKSGGAAAWMQINHPGRVASLPLLRQPVGPSTVAVGIPGMNLRRPRALDRAGIARVVAAFARTAELAWQAGWDGVQVHAAHGYLLSQFLSPLANRREDEYGRDAAGRRRLLLEVVRAVRAAVGRGTPVSVKLNSADFQHGGFSQAESLDVVRALADEGVDLLEISGGNYESPAMMDHAEGHFLGFAETARERTEMPLMLTGGLRDPKTMRRVLDSGAVDVIGLARPLAFVTDYPARLLAADEPVSLPRSAPRTGYRPVDAYLELGWHNAQFRRIAAGRWPQAKPGLGTIAAGLGRLTATALTQGGTR